MPSYDISCEANKVEVKNAVEQVQKEITTRFDFKGSSAKVELTGTTELVLNVTADSDFQLKQVQEIISNKLSKRGVDLRFLDIGTPQKSGGDKVKCEIKIKQGIESAFAKKIVQSLKDSKIKVQASIQGEELRVTGAKRDDLQASMQWVKEKMTELPLTFGNFRD